MHPSSKRSYEETSIHSNDSNAYRLHRKHFNLRDDEDSKSFSIDQVMNTIGIGKKHKVETKIGMFHMPPDDDFTENDCQTYVPRAENITSANINFSKRCPFCKQVVCDGTTLSVFCYDQINFGDDDEYEKEDSFVKAYLF